MDPHHTAAYRQRLEAARADLQTRMASHRSGSHAETAALQFADAEDSHAQLLSAKDDAFAQDALEDAELGAINGALARIDAGTYGDCIDCGKAIPPTRLQAAPEANRCLPCQATFEKAAA